MGTLLKISSELSRKLTTLEVDTNHLYSFLLSKNVIVDFTVEHSSGETVSDRIQDLISKVQLGCLPIIEITSDSNGNTFSVYVASVTNDIIVCVDLESEVIRVEDRYRNIASLENKLILLCEIEDYLERL
jgi:uncharacterized protein (DUF1786 family)